MKADLENLLIDLIDRIEHYQAMDALPADSANRDTHISLAGDSVAYACTQVASEFHRAALARHRSGRVDDEEFDDDLGVDEDRETQLREWDRRND